MITKFDCLITVIDIDKSKMLALKFKIIDNKLYAFNFYNLEEKRKLVEVEKINEVSIIDFVNEIESNDLYVIDKMKSYGIDISNELKLDLLVDGEKIVYDVYDTNSKDEVFTKPHEVNKNINDDIHIYFEKKSTIDNSMLDYASTNIKSLLTILKNISLSFEDREITSNILESITRFNDIYADINDNLDMLFLSTQLLMIESEINFIPNKIEEMMKKGVMFDFGVNNYQNTNNAILTDNKIDYQKVIIMMRNCLAHSNYKLLENGIVEFYNEGKTKMNFTIHKNDLKKLFNKLYNFYLLEGAFPVIHNSTLINNPSPFSKNELISYLNGFDLFELSDPTLKRFESIKKQNSTDDILGYHLYYFKNLTRPYAIVSKKQIIEAFNYDLKEHFNDECKLVNRKITKEDIDYILCNIKIMDIDHFYKLGKTSQIEIINAVIKKKYNKKYELLSNVDEIINCKYDSNDSLTKKSSDYIKVQTKVDLLITTIFNNMFLFCYNQNRSSIDAANIKFPEQIYKDYMESQINEFYDVSKELADYQYMYNSLLKVSELQKIEKTDYRFVENGINKQKNRLIKYKNGIDIVNRIFEEKATEDEYNVLNLEILNRFRDCLAHGKLSVDCEDFNNIKNSKIVIKDVYEGKTKFNTSTTFGEIIKAINNQDFLQSLLNNNHNFLFHSK